MDGALIALLILLPLAASFAAWALGRAGNAARDGFCVAVTLAELVLAVLLLTRTQAGVVRLSLPLCMGIRLRADGFRALYALVNAFLWLASSLLTPEYMASGERRSRFSLFTLLTLAGTQGVFLSEDLMTAFVFFEMASLASYPWVAHEETPGALRAGDTYLAVAVIGGLTALMGLFLLNRAAGTLRIDRLYLACRTSGDPAMVRAAAICVAVGFGAKAGLFPLHIWLPKAHPVAPAPASALLSGALTKVGVFGLLAIGCEIFRWNAGWGMGMVGVGCATMLVGAILALFSNDLKRTLACSSVSQIGFIALGVGMLGVLGKGNALAAGGTLVYMVNHSLVKSTLFLCAGAIYMNARTLSLDELRGAGRSNLLLAACFAVGALSLSGVPPFSGAFGKALLHESIVEGIAHTGGAWPLRAVEWVFLASGGLTFAYMLKLFVCVFVQKPKSPARINAKPMSKLAIILPAAALLALSAVPGGLCFRVAELGRGFFRAEAIPSGFSVFAPENLRATAITLGIGAAVYLTAVRLWMAKEGADGPVYLDKKPAWLDLEALVYRPLIERALSALLSAFALFADRLPDWLYRAAELFATVLARALDQLTDAVLWLLRRTAYRDVRRRPVTNRLVRALSRVDISMTGSIGRSFSFGLLMSCIGLCVALVYVFLHA